MTPSLSPKLTVDGIDLFEIPGIDGYLVSKCGKVFGGKRRKFLKTWTESGRPRAYITGRNVDVARLIAATFGFDGKAFVDGIELFPIPGMDGYRISKCGRVYSDAKKIARKDGAEAVKAARWLSSSINPSSGYACVRIGTIHSLLAKAFLGLLDGQLVDHINGDRCDNSLENLRICSVNQNAFNRSAQINNKSGYKGVSLNLGKWVAEIKAYGVRRRLGRFDSAEDAAKAYDREASALHGAFAKLNFAA
jgi:hypothetical protein